MVERLIAGLPQGFDTHFLKGNHEAILLDFLDDAWRLDHWLMNGGEATMRSYGVDTERLARLGARRPRLGARLSPRRCPRRIFAFSGI